MNKETSELTDPIDQMDLTDIYRIFHLAAAQYIFFSAAYGTFSRIDHILEHKASLNKFKKNKIPSCILSDYNGINLEIKSKRNYRKYSNTWRLNSVLHQ
jgi:thiamine pyrophosphokinase